MNRRFVAQILSYFWSLYVPLEFSILPKLLQKRVLRTSQYTQPWLAIETIPGIKEIEALFVLLEKYPKDAYLTMVSCANGVGKLNSGETWEEALEFIKANKPKSLKGIGVNCTKVRVKIVFQTQIVFLIKLAISSRRRTFGILGEMLNIYFICTYLYIFYTL